MSLVKDAGIHVIDSLQVLVLYICPGLVIVAKIGLSIRNVLVTDVHPPGIGQHNIWTDTVSKDEAKAAGPIHCSHYPSTLTERSQYLSPNNIISFTGCIGCGGGGSGCSLYFHKQRIKSRRAATIINQA